MNMKRKGLLLALALVCGFSFSFAQSRKALRINEVMVENNESVVDEYGEHVGWIELFNANFAPLQISSVYLTNDPNNPKKYPVPLGDEHTIIGKRQTVVFFTDDLPTRGTFHTSFKLIPGQPNWIGLYDADGITLIDSITVPATLPADASYACTEGPNGEEVWEVRNGSTESMYITPNAANTIKDTNHKIENFAEYDSHGFGMAAMAMGIVFAALLVLCLSFLAISKIGAATATINKAKSHGVTYKEINDEDAHDSGEVIAAISMALNQHFNVHDTENTILTINKVKRAYSPWSSKIYGLRQTPTK